MSLIIADGRMHFYQWDTGQQMEVIHEEDCEEVHFCHNGDEAALVCPIREEEGKRVADVPNILLQRAGTLMAYLSEETETGVRICQANSFCVKPRPKPEDYIYTETEILNYTSLSNRLEKLEGEGISQAVEAYLKENPVEAGATAEEAAQIQQNKQDIETLNREKLDADKLPEAVNDALAQAKASGEFKGEKGDPGHDYVLTDADKQEIAELTAPLVDIPEGGSNQPLTFTGAVNATYDGSAPLTVNIPTGGGGSNDWVLIHSMTLEQDTQYIIKDLGVKYNEVRICFENLWCVEGTTAGLAIAVNGGSTGLAAQCASGGTFVNSKTYPCGAIIVVRKESDTFSSCTIMGKNSAGNSQGSGVFPLVYNVANGITKVQFSLSAYGTHTMNTGAIIEMWGR